MISISHTFARPVCLVLILLFPCLAQGGGGGSESFEVEATPQPKSRLQDSFRLLRLDSAVMPPDGLLAFGIGGRNGSTVYLIDGQLQQVNQFDFHLQAEVGLLPWLHAWAEVPWRTWSGGQGWIPPSGSGVGDGRWQIAVGRPVGTKSLHFGVTGGGNLPIGSPASGLTEGVFSPEMRAMLTWRVFTGATVPEMRMHLNVAHTWNRNEEDGYGMEGQGFQPWPPRYQPAAEAGGNTRNDLTTLGVGLEFRKGTASLWLEYSADRFEGNDTVDKREQGSFVGAGFRWGVTEGWAIHGGYLVSLAVDDTETSWYPAFPDQVSSLTLAKQFSIGGRDRDGDGVVDRKDLCPEHPEDLDGFQDEDGCPELDNDGDGIPDRHDLAPDDPEDFDGFADDDGAPDPDNDLDGIPDGRDLCPDEPEDRDGHNDDDGCPDDFEDRDHDGVEDSDDGCPDDAEDRDGFEDDDGCPDLDNDLDGIPDTEDKCPDEPEDYDGDRDEDGCPDEAGSG